MKKYNFDWEDLGCFAIVGIILAVIVIAIGIFLLEGLAVMLLWNWLVPLIFVGAPVINYWMALGIMILCNILFGTVRVISNNSK